MIAWGADVNAVDFNGVTPLHLAIKSSDNLKSTRSVRHLLIKGADRNATDHKGMTPLDIVE